MRGQRRRSDAKLGRNLARRHAGRLSADEQTEQREPHIVRERRKRFRIHISQFREMTKRRQGPTKPGWSAVGTQFFAA